MNGGTFRIAAGRAFCGHASERAIRVRRDRRNADSDVAAERAAAARGRDGCGAASCTATSQRLPGPASTVLLA
jgi:hypothetical protein